MLSETDHPLPQAFATAYKKSASIFLETDIDALSAPENAALMMKALMQPQGKTLASVLSPDTYEQLKRFLSTRGMAIDAFTSYTPTGVALTVSLMELQKLGLRPDLGVDQHFSNKAKKDGKRVNGLESPSEHISFLSDLGKGKEDEFILKTLKDIKQMPEAMTTLKSAWRSGDNKTLSMIAVNEIEKEFPKVYETLLTSRNNRWLVKIEKMLKTTETEFVLVGALHLAGEDGLLTQLKKRGYKIENI